MARRRLRTNFAFNLFGMGLPLATGLVTLPLYIFYIGTARYGVLSIVWILLGYFGFIDFGLSRASANALAKLTNASRPERIGVLITSLHLNLFFGAAGAAALYFAGGFLLRHILTLSDPIAAEVDAALPWIAGMLPLALVGGLGRGAIESKENFFAINSLDLMGNVLGQVLPLLCAVLIAPTLPIVLSAAFLARMISVGGIIFFVILTEKPNTIFMFDRKRFKQLVGFGAWVSVTNLISPVLMFLDQVLVGAALGASAVAHYAVPMTVVARSQIIATALVRTVFPRFSRWERRQARSLAEGTFVSLGFVYGVICAPAIVLSGPFMTLWMGPQFASEATSVLQLLWVGAWINGVAFIPYSFLEGQGRPDLVAKLHALECLPYIIVVWWLLSRFGLIGAAIAWNVRVTVDAVVLLKISGFRLGHLVRLVPVLAAISASYIATQLTEFSSLWALILAGCVAFTLAACAVALDSNLRQVIFALPRRVFGVMG